MDAAASEVRNRMKAPSSSTVAKTLVRLLPEQHLADHLLARDAVRLRLTFDLRFDGGGGRSRCR
jgi:hypothetical protein